MLNKIKSKKGVTLAELVISLSFIGFLVLGTAVLFSISFKGISGGQKNAVAQQQARTFEIALQDAFSRAKKIEATNEDTGGTFFKITEDGLLIVENGQENASVTLDRISGISFSVTDISDASSIVLRCKINYEIKAESDGAPYIIKGGITLNNIKSASKVFGGIRNVSIPADFSTLAIDSTIQSGPVLPPGVVATNWIPTRQYFGNEYVIHQNRLFYAKWVNTNNEPGQTTTWQEVTNEWRWFNTYNGGDIVIYSGASFKAKWNSTNSEPTVTNAWQEMTSEWRWYNTYNGGDIVTHEGNTYRARWVNENHQPPGGPWQLVS